MTAVRWLLVLFLVLALLGLLAYGRGRDHRRGDEVGAVRANAVAFARPS